MSPRGPSHCELEDGTSLQAGRGEPSSKGETWQEKHNPFPSARGRAGEWKPRTLARQTSAHAVFGGTPGPICIAHKPFLCICSVSWDCCGLDRDSRREGLSRPRNSPSAETAPPSSAGMTFRTDSFKRARRPVVSCCFPSDGPGTEWPRVSVRLGGCNGPASHAADEHSQGLAGWRSTTTSGSSVWGPDSRFADACSGRVSDGGGAGSPQGPLCKGWKTSPFPKPLPANPTLLGFGVPTHEFGGSNMHAAPGPPIQGLHKCRIHPFCPRCPKV